MDSSFFQEIRFLILDLFLTFERLFCYESFFSKYGQFVALFNVSPSKNIGMYMNAVKAVQYFIKKAKFIDDIQTAEGIVRACERNQGDTTRTVRKLLKQLDQTNKITELRKFQKVIIPF